MRLEIPKKDVERVRENLRRQKVMNRLLSETPEFNEQARLFKTWIALSSIPYDILCPICGKGHLTFSCGHGDVEGAGVLAGDMVETHSRETKRVREKIKQEHPELAMIPFPNMEDEEKDEY